MVSADVSFPLTKMADNVYCIIREVGESGDHWDTGNYGTSLIFECIFNHSSIEID